jgi:hypothetical protein
MKLCKFSTDNGPVFRALISVTEVCLENKRAYQETLIPKLYPILSPVVDQLTLRDWTELEKYTGRNFSRLLEYILSNPEQ